MEQQNEKEKKLCQEYGDEFLVPSKDPCPKCENKPNHHVEEIPTATLHLSASVSSELVHTEEKKVVNKPIKAILIIILIISPIFGIFIAGSIGFVIGIILDIVAYILGDYAEKRILEKTIERDHYN